MANEIDALIAEFTTNLTALVRRVTLEDVLANLQGGMGGAVRRGHGRPAGKRRGRPVGSKNKPKAGPSGRIRRSSGDLEETKGALLAHVKANPGMRGDQIASALGSDVKTIRGPMKALIAEKQVRTEGQRRGMTYHAGGGGGGKAKAGKKKGRKKAA